MAQKTKKGFASSIIQLAEELGNSPTSIKRWSKLPGAPKKLKDGYKIEAWKKFKAENKLSEVPHKKAIAPNAKEREANARAEFWEMRVKEKRGETFDRDFVENHYNEMVAKGLSFLRSKFIQDLPPVQSGFDSNQIATMNEEALVEFQKMMSWK